MALILCLETATEVCSVALSAKGTLLAIKESATRNVHSSLLTVFIDDVCRSAGINLSEIDALAVSMGPGSYTGIRIGVATAKGLCYSLGKPLIAVSTLQAMAQGMMTHFVSILHQPISDNLFFCPMIDARRMEVYCALYDKNLSLIDAPRAQIVEENTFEKELSGHPVLFAGNGALKCRPLLENHKNTLFIDSFTTSAQFMIPLAEEKFLHKKFENLVYFEPFYLKDFIAGKPRVKGLN
ncbi:MAG: tRNA (adenosine(37)-N6)-threonylcarbamoyltransferase complex dimerization subunit type 1 TsaB [Bacteroidales bacterium]|nr:tRNA (adenosine(37)-N6)-threonylcarbamoyltransferase complex dimerization subunit type 1 TsaB [Bacteroidales bacterium]MDD4602455.1 tRNA (adenosine(37)-N6)-threonylcarbamoyltransferase complex dimerization subunit type 1 TsaB [Bacteroidales bacterium]